MPRLMRLLKCGSWCPTRLPVIKRLTRFTYRMLINLRNDFRLCGSGLSWCRCRSWRRRLSAYTTVFLTFLSRREWTFIVAQFPPLTGATDLADTCRAREGSICV